MTNLKMLAQYVRIGALAVTAAAVVVATAESAGAAPAAPANTCAVSSVAQTRLAGLLLPKRTRLIINYKATMLA